MRSRGRILGPLNWAQLQALRDRGQLARFDQVSEDRQNWIGADSVDRLFPPSGNEGSRSNRVSTDEIAEFIVLDDEGSGSGSKKGGNLPEWYFARGATHEGPIPLSELQRMADKGEIDPETLVWRGGMEQWTPACWVAEVGFSTSQMAAHGQTLSSNATAPGVVIPPRLGGSSHQNGPPTNRTSVLAITGLCMSVFWIFGLGSLSAIVLGVISLRQISRSNGLLTGKRLAIASLILGILGLILTTIGLIVVLK